MCPVCGVAWTDWLWGGGAWVLVTAAAAGWLCMSCLLSLCQSPGLISQASNIVVHALLVWVPSSIDISYHVLVDLAQSGVYYVEDIS